MNDEDVDLGIMIGTQEEAFWRNVIDKTEHEIESLDKMLKFNHAILEMAKQKVEAEIKNKVKGGENGNKTRTRKY